MICSNSELISQALSVQSGRKRHYAVCRAVAGQRLFGSQVILFVINVCASVMVASILAIGRISNLLCRLAVAHVSLDAVGIRDAFDMFVTFAVYCHVTAKQEHDSDESHDVDTSSDQLCLRLDDLGRSSGAVE